MSYRNEKSGTKELYPQSVSGKRIGVTEETTESVVLYWDRILEYSKGKKDNKTHEDLVSRMNNQRKVDCYKVCLIAICHIFYYLLGPFNCLVTDHNCSFAEYQQGYKELIEVTETVAGGNLTAFEQLKLSGSELYKEKNFSATKRIAADDVKQKVNQLGNELLRENRTTQDLYNNNILMMCLIIKNYLKDDFVRSATKVTVCLGFTRRTNGYVERTFARIKHQLVAKPTMHILTFTTAAIWHDNGCTDFINNPSKQSCLTSLTNKHQVARARKRIRDMNNKYLTDKAIKAVARETEDALEIRTRELEVDIVRFNRLYDVSTDNFNEKHQLFKTKRKELNPEEINRTLPTEKRFIKAQIEVLKRLTISTNFQQEQQEGLYFIPYKCTLLLIKYYFL